MDANAKYFKDGLESGLSAIPEDSRNTLLMAADASGDRNDYLYKRFNSNYIAHKFGKDREAVFKDYDTYSKTYLPGAGDNAAAHYGAIQAYYREHDGKVVRPQVRVENEVEQEKARIRELPGAMLAGGARSLLMKSGGTAQIVADVQVPLQYDDPELPEIFDKIRAIDPVAFANYNIGMLQRGHVPSGMQMLRPEQRAEAEELMKRGRQIGMRAQQRRREVAAELPATDLADTFRKSAGKIHKVYGVSDATANSFWGQIAMGIGQLAPNALATLAGPAGWGTIFTEAYEEAYSDYVGTLEEGELADPGEAFRYAASYGTVSTALEKTGIDTILKNVFKEGKDLTLREVSKRIAAGGFGEGVTEASQGQAMDMLARMTGVDPERDLWSMDVLRKRMVEFGVGMFTGQAVTAVGVGTGAAVESSRGKQYISNRLGQPLSKEDFALLRKHKTDDQIREALADPATGDILVKAANGDVDAQKMYNAQALVDSDMFVPTINVGNTQFGEVNGNPVMVNPDIGAIPLDMTNPEHAAIFQRAQQLQEEKELVRTDVDEVQARAAYNDFYGAQAQRIMVMPETGEKMATEAIPEPSIAEREGQYVVFGPGEEEIARADTMQEAREAAMDFKVQESQKLGQDLQDFLDYFEFISGIEADVDVEAPMSYRRLIDEGKMSEAAAREWISKTTNFNTTDEIEWALENSIVLGSSISGFKRRAWQDAIKIYKGASYFTVIEEYSEAYLKAAIERDGDLTWEDLQTWKLDYERKTGRIEYGNDNAGLTEWFSNRSIDYVTGRLNQDEAAEIPSGFKRFLVQFQAYMKHIMARATQLMQLRQAGQLDAALERHLERATGLDAQYVEMRLKALEEQEAGPDPTMELTQVIRRMGGIVSPSRAEAMVAGREGTEFAGELREVWEEYGRGRGLAIFRKQGDTLDQMLLRLRDEGFTFDTPSDLIEAMKRSARGDAIYPDYAGVAEDLDTFQAVPKIDEKGQPAPNQTFMTAWHGSPHKFDSFDLQKIGTGEGAQAYGWGLYFAEGRGVAEWYKNQLSRPDTTAFMRELLLTKGRKVASEISWRLSQGESLQSIKDSIEGSLEQAKRWKSEGTNTESNQAFIDGAEIALKHLDLIEEQTGSVYQVNLAADEDEYLLWDESLSEQSEKIKNAFEQLLKTEAAKKADDSLYGSVLERKGQFVDPIGKDIYAIAYEAQTPKEASLLLHSLGIRGIKYLDATSRGFYVRTFVNGELYSETRWDTRNQAEQHARLKREEGFETKIERKGNYNYVIFDHHDVTIEETFQAVTNTEAFKNWFKESKVVDDDGDPLVVYHGTRDMEFEVFDYAKIGQQGRSEGQGFYFTSDPDVAAGYGYRGRVIQAYLSIQKPMELNQKGFDEDTLRDILWRIAELEHEYDPEISIDDGYLSNFGGLEGAVELVSQDEEALEQLGGVVGAGVDPEFVNKAVTEVTGYDGVHVPGGFGNRGGRGGEIWVAFDPSQIKSVDATAFDPNDLRITFQDTFPRNSRVTASEQTGIPNKQLYETDHDWDNYSDLEHDMMEVARDEKSKILGKPVQLTRQQAARTYRAEDSGFRQAISNIISPIASKLRRINLALSQRLRAHDGVVMRRKSEYRRLALPWVKKMEKLPDSVQDELIIALRDDPAEAQRIMKSYRMWEDFQVIKKVLDSLYKAQRDMGDELGYLEDYFPFRVKDYKGLYTEMYGEDAEEATKLETVIAEARAKAHAKGQELDEHERERIISVYLRGYTKGLGAKPGFQKERTMMQLESRFLPYYASPSEALFSYIDRAVDRIEAKKFFGPHAVIDNELKVNAAGEDVVMSRLNEMESVSAMVNDLIAKGQIAPRDVDRVKQLLTGRFRYQSAPKWVQRAKALTYLSLLNDVSATITQVGDIAWALYLDPIGVLPSLARATVGRSKIAVEDLGIERIGQEFENPGKLYKNLDRMFRYIGFSYMDRIGKETLINTGINKLRKRASKGKLRGKDKEILVATFGDKASQVEKDLAAGNVTPDVQLMAFLILSDFQPISVSEMPEFYARSGTGRLYYTLKTFTLKQLDVFRRETIDEFAKGNYKDGVKNLIMLSMAFYMANVPVDWFKDWMYGRRTDLDDVAIDNLWKLSGFSRYYVYYMREEGPVDLFYGRILAPAMPWIENPFSDMKMAYDKFTKGEDMQWEDFESVRMIPGIGKMLYWWTGKGKVKTERRLEREENED